MNAEHTGLLEATGLETGGSVLGDLLATRVRHEPTPGNRSEAANQFTTLVGKLIGFAVSGVPLVNFANNPDGHPLPARHTCLVAPTDVGRDVVLAFENNDPQKPIIVGLLQSVNASVPGEGESAPVNATVDGEQISLTGKNEIVLRCGKASITLTRAGKIIIRGAYVLTRSSGVNRIKGGSVQIN